MSISTRARIRVVVPEGLEDVAPDYLQSKRRDLTLYQVWVEEKNFGEIEKASHKLKGTAAGYGFDELGRLAKDLNTAAKEQDFSRIETVLREIHAHLDQVDLVVSS